MTKTKTKKPTAAPEVPAAEAVAAPQPNATHITAEAGATLLNILREWLPRHIPHVHHFAVANAVAALADGRALIVDSE